MTSILQPDGRSRIRCVLMTAALATLALTVSACAEPKCPSGRQLVGQVCIKLGRTLDGGDEATAEENELDASSRSSLDAASKGSDAGDVGAACTEGKSRCFASQGPKREQCEAGHWIDSTPCAVDESCFDEAGGAVCKGPCFGLMCPDHASCSVAEGTARCHCEAGYVLEADTCRFDDQCASLSCDENADCTLVDAQRKCVCRRGYEARGVACVNIDECTAVASTCDANALCTDTPGSYGCVCNMGFTGDGKQCANIDDCAVNPCLHGGKCSDGLGGPVCGCAGTGYSGPLCETNVDDCAAKPCKNGGTCSDQVGGFFCDCTGTGYSGDLCQSDVNDCSATPCKNGGTCSDGVNAFTCSCAGTGFTGTQCETNVDDCSASPCKNGGTCSDGLKAFTCSCAGTGFTGAQCETNVDDCAPNPCLNGGTCSDKTNGFTCACPVGFSGTRCETRSCGNGKVDVGEQCDPASSADAKWTCDSLCRPATLYTACQANPSCTSAGMLCTDTGYCSVYPCNATSDCARPAGADVICESKQCWVRCTTLSDCAPHTFCAPTGRCASVFPGCIDDPFACPAGSQCMNGYCVGY